MLLQYQKHWLLLFFKVALFGQEYNIILLY